MLYELVNFDSRTMIGILFWGNLISAILIYSYQATHKSGYDKKLVKLLYFSKFFQSVYYLLVFFRGTISDVMSVNIGNTLLFICLYIEGFLMLTLSGILSKKIYGLLKIILTCSIVLFNFIDIFFQNPSVRVTFNSVFISAILLIPSVMLLLTKSNSKFVKTVGAFYILIIVFMFPRAIYSFSVGEVYIFTNNTIQSLTFTSFILIMIFSAPAFLLIMKEKTDETIREMATMDSLTKIPNRQNFMNTAHVYFENHRRSKNKMAVLFFDIDYFKKVNDVYGHSFGDEVLIRVADIIKHNMRVGDIPCRYGGEEFLAVLPNSNEELAVLAGERVMKEIADMSFQSHPEFKITVSIGIYAGVPSYGDTLFDFINSADMALYEAKNTGRNRIVVGSDKFNISLSKH